MWARRDLSRVSDERPTGALDSTRRASGAVLFYFLLDTPTLLDTRCYANDLLEFGNKRDNPMAEADVGLGDRCQLPDGILGLSLSETSGSRQCPSVSVPSVTVFDGTRVLNLDFDRLHNLIAGGGLD